MQKEIDHLKRNLRHPILTSLPMVKRMATIGVDQGLLLASLSHMMRTIIMSAETEILPR